MWIQDHLLKNSETFLLTDTHIHFTFGVQIQGIFTFDIANFYFNFVIWFRFRIHCQDAVRQGWFDFFILIFIAGNCITLGKKILTFSQFQRNSPTLAMERPTIPPWSTERRLLVICNHLFTMVFTMEMAMKAVAFSLVIGENCYFSDNWNRMDGTLVIVGLIDTLGRITIKMLLKSYITF